MREARDHIIKMLDKGFRLDSRKEDEFREVKVEKGVVPNSEGSAKVCFGDTEVIAGVKMSLEKPYPDCPDRGNISVNVELLPLSSPRYEPGPPQIKAIELARVTDRGIRESGAIDVKALCLEPGEKVWTVFIDVCSVNDAGNLADAISLAAFAAIKDAKFPELKECMIDYKTKTDKGLPIVEEPIEVTVLKIGNHLIVDPVVEEEDVLDARLTVATLPDGKLCAMQKGGDYPLTSEEIEKMIDLATERAKQLREYV